MIDSRWLAEEDIDVMWAKVRKHLHKAEVNHDADEDEWFLEVKAEGWRFDSHGRRFDFAHPDDASGCVFVSFYPDDGNIRFERHIYGSEVRDHYQSCRPGIIKDYKAALIGRGKAGKNRLSYWFKGEDDDIANNADNDFGVQLAPSREGRFKLNYWHQRCPIYLILFVAFLYGANGYIAWADHREMFNFATFALLCLTGVGFLLGALYYFIEGFHRKDHPNG